MREAGSPLLKKSGRWRVQSCSALDGRGVIPGTTPQLFPHPPACIQLTPGHLCPSVNSGMQWLHESMQANN
jgi:hypothetical protein